MSFGAVGWGAYRFAGRLAAPLAGPHLRRRAARGKEDPARSAEKRGVASASLAARPVWLHAVSVGETVAALPLALRLEADGFAVLFTTGTPTAAARLAREAPHITHQYAPLDAPPFVGRFLAHWRPCAALFIEAEVWPTTLHMLGRAGIPSAHVSAKLSERSFARWQRTGPLARDLFGRMRLVLAQSGADRDRFRALGVCEAHATGNLKFDAPPPAAPPDAVAALKNTIGARPVWLAASIHPGEEASVIAAHQHLAADRPDLLTIVAPRHVETAALVESAANAAGIATTRRSKGETAQSLYIADTLGEMGVLFACVPIAFLGGSLVLVGGHNPAEPAAYASALLTGPSHGPMFAPFLAGGGAEMVNDGAALGATVGRLLDAPEARTALTAAASRTLEAERGAIARTMDRIAPILAEAKAHA
ncbi:MAG: 3-deoxy-D-manno-octulosonic acid transferase [Pseudomonadota bacterium]